jgi:hypothetical protein
MKENKISRFFSQWFWISILLVLIGCGITLAQSNIELDNKAKSTHADPFIVYIMSLSAEVFKVGGAALFISNIFTFRIDAEDFIDYIKEQLRSIVLSKDFIANLDIKERKDMLKLILRPSTMQAGLYSNINEYFNKYIDESMELFDVAFRSNLYLIINATYDATVGKIVLIENVSHRIYKVSDKYEPLQLGFEDDDSMLLNTKVSSNDGFSRELGQFANCNKEEIKDVTLANLAKQTIPSDFEKYDHIKVEQKFHEFGNSDWYLFSYRAMRPCDDLEINIECHDNIKVKKCITYGKEENFDIQPKEISTEGCSSVRITYNGWLSPGFGVSVLLLREGSS